MIRYNLLLCGLLRIGAALIGCTMGALPLSAQLSPRRDIEIVAPAGRQTVVSVAGRLDQPLTADADSFAGTLQVAWDPTRRAYALSVVPLAGSGPSTLTLRQQGKAVGLVRVYPVPADPDSAEVTALEATAALPDPTARDYVTITQRKGAAAREFNAAQRDSLRRIQVAGDRVVIEESGQQGILERLMPGRAAATDVDSVTIFADELVIAAPLEIPGATVTIYANRVSFRDPAGRTAFLSTTPRGRSPIMATGAAGADGEPGGDIYLHVRKPLDPTQLATARFIVAGGPGQKGGPPTQAVRGSSRSTVAVEPRIGGILRDFNRIEKRFHDGPLPGGWEDQVVWFRRNGQDEFGRYMNWPGNATPGKPGGAPGAGGRGGSVYSTVLLPPEAVRVAGGPSGERQASAPGAAGGSPGLAFGVDVEKVLVRKGQCRRGECDEDVYKAVYHFYARRSNGVQDVPSPAAGQPTGVAGGLFQNRTGSLHPVAAQASLTYIEDLYRLGFLTTAGERLRDLRSALVSDTLSGHGPGAYLPLRHRVEALLARQATNLDYFGNPAGWVPALDFPTLLQALRSETTESASALALTERIRLLADSGGAQIASLQGVRDAGMTETAQLEARLTRLSAQLPGLRTEAESVSQDEEALLLALSQREAQLAAEAVDQANPRSSFLLGAIRTLGVVARVLPVGQPITGSISAAADLLVGAGEKPIATTLQEVPDVARQFSRANLDASIATVGSVADRVGAMDRHQPRQFYAQLQGAASAVTGSIAEYRRAQEAARAPASAVEAILQQLKAQDPSYRSLAELTAALSKRKGVLAQQIDAVMNEMGEATSRVSVLTASVDVLNGRLTSAQDLVDSPALQASSSIGQAIRSRLDRYHYQMIKAYEFYTAEAYAGDRRTASSAEAIAKVLRDHANDPTAAAGAISNAYTQQVRSVGQQLIQRLTARGLGQQTPLRVPIVGDDLDRVNQMLRAPGGEPDIVIAVEDLGIIPVTDYEARIQNVRVARCVCMLESGGAAGANLRFDVAPLERGLIRTGTRDIGFVQPVNALAWSATVDLTSTRPRINTTTTPKIVGRALQAAFGLPADDAGKTAPALLPGVTLRAQLHAAPSAAPTRARVRELDLEIEYSYHQRLDLRGVHVVPTGIAGAPYFFVSRADESGQQHAHGTFTRTYTGNAAVQITAPSAVGDAVFKGWYRRGQKVARGGPTLELPSTAGSFHYEARYGPQ